MRRRAWALIVLALVGLAGIIPARGEQPVLVTFSFCTGDGPLQIFDTGPVADDIFLLGDIGCLVEGGSNSAIPVHVETVIGASTVATAGDCGGGGLGQLTGLRMRVKMTFRYKGRNYTAVRTWTGRSSGDFPGSNINGLVRDAVGVAKLGRFRLEPFPGWYCSYQESYIRLWNVVIGPAPGA